MNNVVEKKVRLLIVDDHPVMLEGIRSSLASCPLLEIVGEAGTGDGAIRKAKEFMAEVVLMDINMPGMNGLTATELLRAEAPEIKVLILTVHNNREYVRKISRCGGGGYILNDDRAQERTDDIHLDE